MSASLVCRFCLALLLVAKVGFAQAQAQDKGKDKDKVKQLLATSTCACVEQKQAARTAPLTKEGANQMLTQCMMAAAGKDLKAIQAAYGTNAFNDVEVMRQLGREVGGLLLQHCQSFTVISLAMAGKDGSASSGAATTGQTVGTLGKLRGTAFGLLDVQVSKTENATFAWLHRFEQAADLLAQLPQLQGRKVRVSWQEVELLQPDTQQYQKLREITGIELL